MQAPVTMDALDTEILRRLTLDARRSFLEIGRELKVSGATIHDRVSKLREKGILEGFHARVNQKKLGRPIVAFVGLVTSQKKDLLKLMERLVTVSEVEEAHTVTGKYDFLLKLRASDNEQLQQLLLDKIGTIPGVVRHETMMALSTILERNGEI